MTPVLGPVEARLVLELAGLPGLRVEHTLTRRALAAIPAAHEHYRPRVGARSAGEFARQIVSAEIRFLDGAATGAFADRDNALEAAWCTAEGATSVAARRREPPAIVPLSFTRCVPK